VQAVKDFKLLTNGKTVFQERLESQISEKAVNKKYELIIYMLKVKIFDKDTEETGIDLK